MLSRVQKGSNTYAVYELSGSGALIDNVSVSMINNNQGDAVGLAPISFEALNGVYNKVLFDITGKVSLREYIGGNITQASFKRMITQLIEKIEQFDDYMIDVRHVLLDLDSVFINAIDYSISFICIPVKDMEQSGDLCGFFRNVVENSRVEISTDEVDYFHCVWNVIRSGNGFSLSNMKNAMTAAKMEAPIAPQISASVPDKITEKQEQSTAAFVPNITPLPSLAPADDVPVVPPPAADDKKKGFLGKLFSPKKKKNDSYSNSSYQGGLAGLKNGAKNNNQIPFQSPQPVAPMNSAVSENFPSGGGFGFNSVQNPNPQKHMDFGGTTVLKSCANPNSVGSVANSTFAPPVGVPEANSTFVPPVGVSEANNTFAPPVGVPEANNTFAPPAGRPEPHNTSVPPFLRKKESFAGADNSVQSNALAGSIPASPAKAAHPVRLKKTEPSEQNTIGGYSQETTVLQGSYSRDTTVLNYSPAVRAYLIREKNGDKLPLDKPVIRIGRDRSDMDYCVNDNTNVGHTHANISVRGGEYFIRDLNSKNHTYVNGVMVPNDDETKLVNGDKVTLADEVFELRLL